MDCRRHRTPEHLCLFSSILLEIYSANNCQDLLTALNSYPYLDTKMRPVFSSQLSDITPRPRPERVIDITDSVYVPADELREKLQMLQAVGELDGGLPIVRNNILVGLIPAPDLEFALDNLQSPEQDELCCMEPKGEWSDGGSDDDSIRDPTYFSPYIDPAPVALERHSPMELVYECFAKLGLRYMCVLRDGQFDGVVCIPKTPTVSSLDILLTAVQVHKKTFVKYLMEVTEGKVE